MNSLKSLSPLPVSLPLLPFLILSFPCMYYLLSVVFLLQNPKQQPLSREPSMCPVICMVPGCLLRHSLSLSPVGRAPSHSQPASLHQDFGLSSAQLSIGHTQGLPCGTGSCQSMCQVHTSHQEVETVLTASLGGMGRGGEHGLCTSCETKGDKPESGGAIQTPKTYQGSPV